MPDPSICAQCAATYPTCCRIMPGEEESCFPISPDERKWLEGCEPVAPGPLFASANNSRPFLRHLRRLFPQDVAILPNLFAPGHSHLRLALDIHGRCVFLGPAGCIAPQEHRPWFCRLYPFWFVGRRLTGFASPSCLAVQKTSSLEELCSLFNTTRSNLWGIYAGLRRSWGLDMHD